MKRNLIKYALLSLLIFTHLGCAASATRTFQQVRVDKNRFVTQDSQQVVFRGVNVYDPLKLSTQGYNPDNYFKEAAAWGSTIVRQCVHPKSWKSTDERIARGLLEQAITTAGKNGLYSIIDWHSIGIIDKGIFENDIHTTTTDETLAFWQLIAQTYKGDKRVAFYELFNEPSYLNQPEPADGWIGLRDWYETVIDAIRAVDPDKTIIVAGLDWAYNLKAIKDNPIRRENIAYAVHPYPMKGLSWDDNFGYLKNDVALIGTEFGFDNSDSMLNEGSYTKAGGQGRYRDDIIKYFEDNKMSWVAWSFTHDWKPSLLASRDFNPSESGAFIKETLLRLNQGPTRPKSDAAKYVHADILSAFDAANQAKPGCLSYGKKAVALSNENESMTPDKITDGNRSSRWGSVFKQDPTWIYVDLEKETDIAKVVIYWEVAYSKQYKIQVSNDATTWTDVKEVKNGSGGSEEFQLNTKGRYLRIFAEKRATEWGTSIWELEVY